MRPSNILIIDPDSGSRATLAGLLHDGVRTIATCSNGQAAKYHLAQAAFDAIVLDDGVPGRWIEVLNLIQQAAPEAGIVVLVTTEPRLIPPGAIEVLRKPAHAGALETAVCGLLSRQAALSPTGDSAAFRAIQEAGSRASRALSPVLILGETGVGKEVLARRIHDLSRRRAAAFLAVNSGGIPGSLIETTLFGYVKGAFTGAAESRPGVFEKASGGTLFLDEIGDMPLEVQVKLLRALDSRKIVRVGDHAEISVDVRIIAATHRDLMQEVVAGRFRADLYYRIAVSVIRIPPLRHREGDIDLLAPRLLAKRRHEFDQPADGISAEALAKLRTHAWPGNIRELDNVLQRAVLAARQPFIQPEDIIFDPSPAPASQALLELTWEKLEHEYFSALIERHQGNNKAAAEAAGMPASTLSDKLKRLGLRESRQKLVVPSLPEAI